MKRFSFLILIILALFSCVTRNTIVLNANGSGTVDADFAIDNLLVKYIFDLQEVMSGKPVENRQLFDKQMVLDGLGKSKSVKILNFENPSNNRMKLKLSFNNINTVITEAETTEKKDVKLDEKKIREIINFVKTSTGYKFNFFLNKKNFNTLMSIIPEDIKMLVAVLGPSLDTEENMTKEDYYMLLEEILADYPESKNIKKIIDDSKIVLTIKSAEKIISQKGGVLSGNSVTFTIPILDLVILDKPIDLEVIF